MSIEKHERFTLVQMVCVRLHEFGISYSLEMSPSMAVTLVSALQDSLRTLKAPQATLDCLRSLANGLIDMIESDHRSLGEILRDQWD